MHKSIRALQKVSSVTRINFGIKESDAHSTTTRISKRQLFLNQQAARIDNVYLSIASSSIRDGHIETRTRRKEYRMVASHKFAIRQC